MAELDPYDIAVAFDDLSEELPTAATGCCVIGDEELPGRASDRIAQWVDAAVCHCAQRPQLHGEVRLDDEPSYDAFRFLRKIPYLAKLEDRLDVLEKAHAQHLEDHQRNTMVVLGDEVLGAAKEAAVGGKSIKLPCCDGGAIECWQDGNEVLCTVRFLTPGGVRMATGSSPIAGSIAYVLKAALDTELKQSDLIILGEPLAATLTADSLVRHVCGTAAAIMERQKPIWVQDQSVATNWYLYGIDLMLQMGG